MNLRQRDIFAPDITVEILLVKRVQSFHHDDVYFPGEGSAVDDLKSKVLIRLGSVELTEPNKVRLVELIDDSFYDVFFVNNRSLRGDGNGENEKRSCR